MDSRKEQKKSKESVLTFLLFRLLSLFVALLFLDKSRRAVN